MASDQQIAEALDSLLRNSSPYLFTSLTNVLHELQAKLGQDLTHKIDFIHNQLQLFFRSLPQQQPPQPLPRTQQQPSAPKSHFVHNQNPNLQSGTSQIPSNFSIHRSEPQAVILLNSESSAPNGPGDPPKAPTQRATVGGKRKGGPGGLNKLCGVSPELQVIVGHPALPRTEIVKQLWAYIRKNNLQDPSNKRKIICNDELRVVFETDCTDMFKMNKLLAKHILPLEPSKQPGQPLKKVKEEDEETVIVRAEPPPTLIISEALAIFFGSSEREMLQSEVLRRVWEYIKVNRLEDPMNPKIILCDAKLQELLGCGSISALGIPETLARRHLFKRS